MNRYYYSVLSVVLEGRGTVVLFRGNKPWSASNYRKQNNLWEYQGRKVVCGQVTTSIRGKLGRFPQGERK